MQTSIKLKTFSDTAEKAIKTAAVSVVSDPSDLYFYIDNYRLTACWVGGLGYRLILMA